MLQITHRPGMFLQYYDFSFRNCSKQKKMYNNALLFPGIFISFSGTNSTFPPISVPLT
ncbi:hypothetical protein BKA82DRAFT_373166 [Pisolithus tinctorius]|nr:hypothetical protein BKA82DRAFT_373166 [Pisolithus tinctorius]KIN94685.1 hypothetical protein M404DRAFT_373166 [Pisolithus tinctorius Marx 270]